LEEANGVKVLTEDEAVIVAYITAKVDMQLQSIKKRYASPENYGKSIFKQINQKDKLIASSLLLNISDLDPELLYQPEKLRELAAKQLHVYIGTDSLDMLTTSESNVESINVKYQDMTRALRELDRDVGLEYFKTKADIKKEAKSNQSMKFSGSPSAYRLPHNISVLKTVQSNPVLVRLIIKTLTKMGLVENLAFFGEGFLYAVRLSQISGKESIKHLLISAAKSSSLLDKTGVSNKSYVETFCEFISSLDNRELKAIARDTAESMVQNPELCCNILLSFLLKPPLIRQPS
jgi:hypothetical protein